ncbi:hypothetical protein FOXG_07150 [Fusarium oxysporum f. sp. lycopersici 4287]|uniref:Heterokaryon incompatibility domain-containing protein n=1 Tax=Fusarium oxysporum f. sp. lycopersici (strain 4287 / CBS 123668 / FGSC 9935 / NRRL 34936) TaxID=426428 RepID=A0A0J9V5J7_FUSO4|nr:hypothetical protein FOXG_07150 [Fusarium oxysporum f. sp. lycopersici 4287]KNB06438.1 hypothetical protein FOXG_07150 [Fusarium oxysporum f. sp. lycopersici 4287]
MNHFNEGAGSTETTMQRLNVTHSESGFVSLDRLIPPRPDNQPCPCCFALDAPTAIRSDGNQITWNRRESVIFLRRSMREMEVSTISGCQICSVLFEILIFFGLDHRDDGSVRNIELRIPTDLGNLGISFYNSWTELYVQVYMSPHERTWNRIRPLPDICAHQLSDESLSFVRSCLQTCLNKHTLCWQSEGGLPARLLDVGRCGDSAIRLVETESAASVKYIALSYCWGDNVTVKTTLAGLENMKSGISISELLQAYVDAVALTRELGIQYLWIDALCIIQDSHEDWVKESAKMSGIYAKAYLTIAAASSGSANQPFLRHSLPTGSHQDKYYTRVFSKQVVDGEGSHLLKARVIPESGVHSKWQDCYDECFPREPWSQRGWTLQEQLLSTRLLSFSLTEMQWTCQEAVLCECRSKLNHRRLFGQKPVSQITRAFDAFRFWHKVVENYSNRLLTNPQDKLTAISGIAAILQQKTQSRYAAGLWADNIDMDLLWRRATPTTKLSRSEFVAPSFSWASIDGEVDYCCFRNGKRSYRKSASVVAVVTNTSREAPLGRVESGRLIIHGPLNPGFIEDSSHNGVFVVKLGRIRLDLIADAPLQQTIARGPEGNLERTVCRWSPRHFSQNLSTDNRGSPSMEGPGGSDQLPVTATSTGTPSSSTRCWALKLGCFPSTLEPESPQRWDHELLILGKSPRRPGDFERLGLVTYCIEEGRGSTSMELSEQEHVATITLA